MYKLGTIYIYHNINDAHVTDFVELKREWSNVYACCFIPSILFDQGWNAIISYYATTLMIQNPCV